MMRTKWWLLAEWIFWAVPACCMAVGQAGLGGQSGMDLPVGSGGQGAAVGQPAGLGLGLAAQVAASPGPQNALGTAVGMPQRIQERVMNQEMLAAGTAPEGYETPVSEDAGSDADAADEGTLAVPRRPSFVSDLVDEGLLTEDQVGAMRTTGAGWGNIKISAQLANLIAATTPEDGAQSADQTAATTAEDILAIHQNGMGFGQIALFNDLKLGPLPGNSN